MLKILKSYTMVSISALVLIGCGGSGTNSKAPIVNNSSKALKVEGLKSLQTQSNLENLENSGFQQTMANNSDINDTDSAKDLCQTGTVVLSGNEQLFTMNAKQCHDGESTIDGAASVKIDPATETSNGGTLTITRDINLDDSNNNFSIEEGGVFKVKRDKSGDTSTLNIVTSFKSNMNGVIFNVSGLNVETSFTKTEELEEMTGSVTVKAGEFNIGEYYFKIDETKSNTITVEDNDNVTGTIYMTDGAGHKIELVSENNAFVVKIDENGDGTFSENEILK